MIFRQNVNMNMNFSYPTTMYEYRKSACLCVNLSVCDVKLIQNIDRTISIPGKKIQFSFVHVCKFSYT